MLQKEPHCDIPFTKGSWGKSTSLTPISASPSVPVSSRIKHNYRIDEGMMFCTAENRGNATLGRFLVAYGSETTQ